MVLVKYFATLRELTGKREEIIEDVDSVEELLELLFQKYGERFREEIEKKNMILVNGKNIIHIEGVKTRLKEGDVVSIFPPAGGG